MSSERDEASGGLRRKGRQCQGQRGGQESADQGAARRRKRPTAIEPLGDKAGSESAQKERPVVGPRPAPHAEARRRPAAKIPSKDSEKNSNLSR